MEPNTLYQLSAPKGELVEPPQSSKPITASSYVLRPGFIAMVREQTFSGLDYENPYHHLREFEQLCACLTISGMSQESLRWKLFPFSLEEKAKQWYAHNVGKVKGDWEELRNRFCLTFFPISRVAALRQEILSFQQQEKETIGAAWDRFLVLTRSGLDLSIPSHVLLQHFWLGLHKESALQLDIAAGGSFNHKTTAEGEALLDLILENTPPLEPLRVEPEPEIEEVSIASTDNTPIETSPTISGPPKEDFQPSDLPFFEDDLFKDFENTSKYSCQRKPQVATANDQLDEDFIKHSINELSAIMSQEWTKETELSSDPLQINTPSSSIQCKIRRSWQEALYNPLVGANLMSKSFMLTHLGSEPLAPTEKTLRVAPRTELKSCGILHQTHVRLDNIRTSLDFYVFDIKSFDILIGHPLKRFTHELPATGAMNVKLGRDTFSIPITRAKNSVTDCRPDLPLPKEVMAVSPFENTRIVLR